MSSSATPSRASQVERTLLDRIRRRLLLVNLKTLVVQSYHQKRRRYSTKIPNYHPVSGRARFNFDNTTVYRNRLIWIAANSRVPPADYVVDHIDGDCTNDLPNNLRLMTRVESSRQGFEAGLAKDGWRSWQLLMEYVEFNGHWPPDGSPYWD